MATEAADTISGGRAGDTLAGAGGGDNLHGGNGNDVLYGFGEADLNPETGDAIRLERVAGGLARSLFAASPPGQPDSLYILEQHTGRIQVLDLLTGVVAPTPFLDIPDDQLSIGNEQGLLGLAFHPDYAVNGRFYVDLTNADGTIEVREYTRSVEDPAVADAGSGKLILSIAHPRTTNHNGGWLGFGPDGFLYIAVGDGGGSGDTNNDAQNTDSLLGKMLRIDVDGDDFPGDAGRNYAVPESNPFVDAPGADEVWAYGLRNPWRASFDRLTGDFYIGDVGQNLREEVNLLRAGTGAGANFGWHVREGDTTYDADTPGNPAPDDPSLIDPILVYPHVRDSTGGFSVTGGYAYRGPGGMQGHYFFADYATNNFWTTKAEDDADGAAFVRRNPQLVVEGGTLQRIASFAEDGRGRLYAIELPGEIYRITPDVTASDGADTLNGGNGDDRVFGGVGEDLLLGGAGNDSLSGGRHGDDLRGGGGGDTLAGDGGDDSVSGEAGDDTIAGGSGRDMLNGGVGADTFAFTDETDSTVEAPDIIRGFEAGVDEIDLSAIESGSASGAFTFIGAARFSETPGELRAYVGKYATLVQADTDGDGEADLLILLSGRVTLEEGDFVL